MSFSLYYEAKRSTKLSEHEHNVCTEIVERYCSQYPFQRKTEDFCVYPYENDERIFRGATKLPNTPKMLMNVSEYWFHCLTEITNYLQDAVWEVRFDDVDLVWDVKEGWRFPNDEEYKKQKNLI